MRKLMEGYQDVTDEIQNFIKVWFSAILSLVYCYYVVSKLIPEGLFRLIFVLPIFYLFAILPLSLNSLFLAFITAFCLTWLGSFKLLLFSFNLGPLCAVATSAHPQGRVRSSTDPSKSLVLFVSLACLPIKLKHNNSSTLLKTKYNSYVILGLRVLICSVTVRIYDYREYLNPNVILVVYCLHLYICAEITLNIGGAFARTILGRELEPPFDEPYLSTSLQEFWGRRWNLMVTSILRSTVYDPIRRICTPVIGKNWATPFGVIVTFSVSGVMHEVLYYYVTRVHPTWEVTWFFVLHGVCRSLEGGVKKSLGTRWVLLNQWVSRIIYMGFAIVTGVWFFFPQLTRNGVDIKVVDEYRIFVEFCKNKVMNFPMSLQYNINRKVVE